MSRADVREKFTLVFLCGAAYFLMDVPVRMTGILPSFAGIKNFLPFTLGLFFGAWGTAGCVIGSISSALMVGSPVSAMLYECLCVCMTGLGMFCGWHFLTKSHAISFKAWQDYARYIFLLCVLSGLCCDVRVSLAYFLTGLLIGIPVNILFASVLYIMPVMPRGYSYEYDAVFCLMQGAESLEDANELIEAAAEKKDIPMKRVLEIQSCIEELLIRILNAVPDTRLHVFIQYGDAISARIHYGGTKYNPFRITSGDDEIDIVSLKIIKHRALRASFSYSEGTNKIHVVV